MLSLCFGLKPLVMQELLATPERKEKLRPIADMPNINGDTRTLPTPLV